MVASLCVLLGCPSTPSVFKCDPATRVDCPVATDGGPGPTGGRDGGHTGLDVDAGPDADGGLDRDGGPSSPQPDAGNGATDPTIIVSGDVTFHHNRGTWSLPVDFTDAGVGLTLQVWEPDASVLTAVPGTYSPGRVEFTNIPRGQRFLRSGTEWNADFASTFDWSSDSVGRPDREYTDGGTTLELTMSGFDPFSTSQTWELAAPGSFTSTYYLGLPLADGDTSAVASLDYINDIAEWVYPLSIPAPLINTERGDSVFLTQGTVGQSEWFRAGVTLTKAATISSLVVKDHQTTKAVANFVTAPLHSLTLDVRSSQFAQYGADSVGAPELETREGLGVWVVPFGPTDQNDGSDLLSGSKYFEGSSVDKVHRLTYGNPFPSSWVELVSYSYCFNAKPVAISDQQPQLLRFEQWRARNNCTYQFDLAQHASAQPIEPMLSPPRALKLDGIDAYAAAGRVVLTPTPTLSWSAPAKGTPSRYLVSITKLTVRGPGYNSLGREFVASLVTAETSLRVPPGILTPGDIFTFKVTAQLGSNWHQHENGNVLPSAFAPAAAGAFVVDDQRCAHNNGGCDANALCTPTSTGRTCTCQAGYTGTGTACSLIDPCTNGTARCAAASLCETEFNGFHCSCNSGNNQDSTCSLDSAWRRAEIAPNAAGQLVYDASRNEVELIAAPRLNSAGGLWSWNGAHWTLRTAGTPASFSFGLAAYDVQRGQVLVKDGALGHWELDESNRWVQQRIDQRICQGPMAYDEARHVTVLGCANGDGSRTTYEFDGLAWRLTATDGPQFTSATRLTYDRARQRIVLHNPTRATSSRDAQTWEYTSTGWAFRSLTGPEVANALIFDVARNKTVLFAGTKRFFWDGTSWTSLPDAPGAPTAAVYDVARSCTVARDTVTSSLWEECNSTWRQVLPAAARPIGMAVADTTGRRVLDFTEAGAWQLDGGVWSAPVGTAPNIKNPVVAYDSARNVFVEHANSRDTLSYETWEWDDATLTPVSKGPGPLTGDGQAIAYDAQRAVTVVFGGIQYSPNTFVWNGSMWSTKASTGPAPRAGASMAYDPVNRVVIMAGGSYKNAGTTTYFDDTWSWDGTLWKLVAHTPAGLPAGSIVSMTYNARSGVVVAMTAGAGNWNYVSGVWYPAESYEKPLQGTITYDPARSRLVNFDGVDTWFRP